MSTLNTTNEILLVSEKSASVKAEDLMIDQIGKTVAISLDRELKHLSPKVLASLERSRNIALSHQKKSSTQSSPTGLGFFNIKSSINWVGMIVVTMVALYFVIDWQQTARINDLADFDTALLSDSVPPDAYADDGFKVFLKEMIQRKENEAKNNMESKPVENSALTEAVKDASQNP